MPSSTPELVYVVKSGDTLYSIAAELDTTAEALSAVNSIPDPDLIPVGLELVIPRSEDANVSSTGSSDPCEGYRAIASQLGGLLAQLRLGMSDFTAALHTTDRLNAELRQLPKSFPSYQELESAVGVAAVAASAASVGRSNDAVSAIEDARSFLDAGQQHIMNCTSGE